DKFRQVGGQHISQLNPGGASGNQFSEAAWGLMPSDKAVVFLQNHDTQHQCGLSYRDGKTFRIANVWMLAQPYGYPSILSSFAFNCPGGNSMGPPSDASGNTNDLTCVTSLATAVIGEWGPSERRRCDIDHPCAWYRDRDRHRDKALANRADTRSAPTGRPHSSKDHHADGPAVDCRAGAGGPSRRRAAAALLDGPGLA